MTAEPIAIVGLAARFPDGGDAEELWRNLVGGREPDPTRDPDLGDAALFGFTPGRAERLDPRARLLLTTCHGALEDAGYDPFAMPGRVGAFGSAEPALVVSTLDLSGPAVTIGPEGLGVLGAVRRAAAALRCGDCDAAVAGATDAGIGAAVLLKRLADARADGDTVRAVVLGCAVADGPAAGVTAATRAMAEAGVSPAEIGYVEVPATGASVAEAYHALRDAPPPSGWPLGSVRSGGAVVGFVKVVLALDRAAIPASAHPHAPDAAPFAVVTRLRSWHRNPAVRRIASVCAVGADGTQAHAVLAEGPGVTHEPPDGRPRVVVWSAGSAAGERRMRERLQRSFAGRSARHFPDAVGTLQYGRSRHPVRAAAVCHSAEEAAACLSGSGRVFTGRGAAEPAVAYVLPGTGLRSARIAADLYGTVRAFTIPMDECLDAFDGLDLQLYRRWRVAAADPTVTEPTLVQPLLFAVGYALAAMWREAGVAPVALLGHGLGELTAAAVAGVFTLPDAARIVAGRAEAMAAHPVPGGRAAADRWAASFAGVAAAAPVLPCYSAHAGGAVSAANAGQPGFWTGQLVAPERFAAALSALEAAHRPDVLLELGPRGAVTGLDGGGRTADAGRAVRLDGLGADGRDRVDVLTVAARLWVLGRRLHWQALEQPAPLVRVPLPGYPHAPTPRAGRPEPVPEPEPQPVVAASRAVGPPLVWHRELSAATDWTLDEHRVGSVPLMPATALLELAVRAYRATVHTQDGSAIELSDVVFLAPLLDRSARSLRVTLRARGGHHDAVLSSRPVAGDGGWTAHATARIRTVATAPARVDLAGLRHRFEVAGQPCATGPGAGPVERGPRWQTVTGAHVLDGERLLRVELPAAYRADLAEHPLHPALLDAVTAAWQAPGRAVLAPTRCRRLLVHAPLPASFHAYVRHHNDPRSGDADLIGADGTTVVSIAGLTVGSLVTGTEGGNR